MHKVHLSILFLNLNIVPFSKILLHNSYIKLFKKFFCFKTICTKIFYMSEYEITRGSWLLNYELSRIHSYKNINFFLASFLKIAAAVNVLNFKNFLCFIRIFKKFCIFNSQLLIIIRLRGNDKFYCLHLINFNGSCFYLIRLQIILRI